MVFSSNETAYDNADLDVDFLNDIDIESLLAGNVLILSTSYPSSLSLVASNHQKNANAKKWTPLKTCYVM